MSIPDELRAAHRPQPRSTDRPVHSVVAASAPASVRLPSFAGVEQPDEQPATLRGHDLRMPVVGTAGWLGGIAAAGVGAWSLCLPIALVVLAVAPARQGSARAVRLVAACAVVAGGVVGGTLLRSEAVAHGALRAWAEEEAVADLSGTVVSDPVVVEGPWGRQVLVRLRVHRVTARGATYDLGGIVLVLGDPAWSAAALGSEVRTVGRLAVADDGEVAALVVGARPPVRIRGPDVWWRAAASVRSSIRDSVGGRPEAQRALVPALVVGDDAGLPDELQEDFRTTGLTHLTAVSGTNLTLVVGFLLLLARSLGLRGRWLTLVGLLGIIGFVLLARTEPSVVRAAAMGTVGLFALATDGRRRGLRALGVAVTVLLLVTPSLAVSAGFALSVLATAGIVLLGPPVQAALARWLPAPVAGAIAVPFAAQLACTPVIAALSGQVSLVAVLANLAVAPVVGPATVLGLAGGLAGLVCGSGRTRCRHHRRCLRGLDRAGGPAGRRPAGAVGAVGVGRGRDRGPLRPVPGRGGRRARAAPTAPARSRDHARLAGPRARCAGADRVAARLASLRLAAIRLGAGRV